MTPEITAKIAEIERSIDPLGLSRHSAEDVRWLLTALADCQREIERLHALDNIRHDSCQLANVVIEQLKKQLADAATREAGKNKMIASLQGELADWYALGADTPDGLQVQLQEMLETIAALSDTPLVRKLVESDGILGDMLVVKEKRIVELEAELEKERSLATTFLKQRDAMQGERDQLAGEAPDLTSLPKAVWNKIVAPDLAGNRFVPSITIGGTGQPYSEELPDEELPDEPCIFPSNPNDLSEIAELKAERDQLAAAVERLSTLLKMYVTPELYEQERVLVDLAVETFHGRMRAQGELKQLILKMADDNHEFAKQVVSLEAEVQSLKAMQAERDQQVAEKQAWIDSYYEQIHVSLLYRAERDQLAAEVRRHIIQFRSIEASLGTLDQSEAIDDERALPDWVSTKVAEIVDTYAVHNQSAMLVEQSERLRKLRETVERFCEWLRLNDLDQAHQELRDILDSPGPAQ